MFEVKQRDKYIVSSLFFSHQWASLFTDIRLLLIDSWYDAYFFFIFFLFVLNNYIANIELNTEMNDFNRSIKKIKSKQLPKNQWPKPS